MTAYSTIQTPRNWILREVRGEKWENGKTGSLGRRDVSGTGHDRVWRKIDAHLSRDGRFSKLTQLTKVFCT